MKKARDFTQFLGYPNPDFYTLEYTYIIFTEVSPISLHIQHHSSKFESSKLPGKYFEVPIQVYNSRNNIDKVWSLLTVIYSFKLKAYVFGLNILKFV